MVHVIAYIYSPIHPIVDLQMLSVLYLCINCTIPVAIISSIAETSRSEESGSCEKWRHQSTVKAGSVPLSRYCCIIIQVWRELWSRWAEREVWKKQVEEQIEWMAEWQWVELYQGKDQEGGQESNGAMLTNWRQDLHFLQSSYHCSMLYLCMYNLYNTGSYIITVM